MYVHKSNIIVFILVVLVAGLILASACTPATPLMPTPTPTMSPLDIVKAYEEAFNRHDITGVMALLTEEVVHIRPYDGDSFRGKNFVQGFVEVWAGSNGEAHFTDCTNSAELVSCKLAAQDDCTRSFGMDAYHWEATFKLVGDKISVITWDHDNPDDYKQYVGSSGKALYWLAKSNPDKFKQWQHYNELPNYGHSVEKGKLLSEICKEYAASGK